MLDPGFDVATVCHSLLPFCAQNSTQIAPFYIKSLAISKTKTSSDNFTTSKGVGSRNGVVRP